MQAPLAVASNDAHMLGQITENDLFNVIKRMMNPNWGQALSLNSISYQKTRADPL